MVAVSWRELQRVTVMRPVPGGSSVFSDLPFEQRTEVVIRDSTRLSG